MIRLVSRIRFCDSAPFRSQLISTGDIVLTSESVEVERIGDVIIYLSITKKDVVVVTFFGESHNLCDRTPNSKGHFVILG